MTHKRPIARPVACRGFTLTEMIISIALVLVLMLAITRIFSITSTTIGASQGFAAATRDARAAQAVMAHDFSSLAADAPFFWIRQDLPTPAFRNNTDLTGDRDAAAATTAAQLAAAARTQDLDGDGIVNSVGEQASLLTVDGRNHRLDRVSFFARDRFSRQTANNPATTDGQSYVLVSDMSGPEAWITYGHVTLPFPNGVYGLSGTMTAAALAAPATAANAAKLVADRTYPGVGDATTNPLNYFASDWVLGRVAMVLKQPVYNGAAEGSVVVDTNGNRQEYFGIPGTTGGTSGGTQKGTTFLLSDTTSNLTRNGAQVTTPAAKQYLFSGRYDLFGGNVAEITDNLQAYIENATTTTIPWYARMLNYRFQVNPFVAKPIGAKTAASAVPAFVPACSQFVVEYAGDFVTQRPNGSLNDGTASGDVPVTYGGLESDGQIDFHYDATTGSKQIQWYGMPRASANGSTDVRAARGDVVPLGVFVHYISGGSTSTYANSARLTAVNPDFATFEKFVKYTTDGTPASNTDTAPYTYPTNDIYPATFTDSDASYFDTYYAAFDPSTINNAKKPRPKLVRITLTIDRPELAGRTAAGQVFEYVYTLQ